MQRRESACAGTKTLPPDTPPRYGEVPSGSEAEGLRFNARGLWQRRIAPVCGWRNPIRPFGPFVPGEGSYVRCILRQCRIAGRFPRYALRWA